MTTRINVNLSGFDAIALKQRADIDIQANRDKYVENERLKIVKEKGLKQRAAWIAQNRPPGAGVALDLKGNFLGWSYGGRRPSRWRPDELAAVVLEKGKKIGVTWFNYDTPASSSSSFTWMWEVRSGDFSIRLQGSTGYVQGPNEGFPGANYFIIPAGGDVGIVVPCLYAFPTSALAFVAAFLVSPSTARQIAVPPSLQSILSGLQTNDLFYSSDVGWADAFAFEGEYSPSVFQYLGVGSKQFPVGKNYILRDYRFGILSGGIGGNPEREPVEKKIYFAEWLGDPESFDETNSALLLSLRDSAVSAPTYSFPPGILPSFFWDWDDPEYCRQMCLALGFSAADLTP